MLAQTGIINNRDVLYLSTTECEEWFNFLPDKNWVVLVIANKSEIHQLERVAKECLNRNVLYVCGTGEAASEIDDEFDMGIVNRKIAAESDDYGDTPMTVFDTSLEDELWFAIFVAVHETEAIAKIICINLTPEDLKDEISRLVTKMNTGWIPGE
jgi:hypothetical protein